MRTILRQSVSAMLSCAILCTGCTKTRVAMVGRNDNPIGESAQPVRYAGTYSAAWAENDRDHLHRIPGSGRYAKSGDRLGFNRFANGLLIGTHGETRVELAGAPPTAKYVVWINQKKVQTQFGREMDKIGDGTVVVLQALGTGVLIVGVGALWLYSETHDADACENPSYASSKERHKHHHEH